MRKLLQILSVVGMLLCSGQFETFGSDPNRDNDDLTHVSGTQLVIATTDDSRSAKNPVSVSMSSLPPEVMLCLFENTSESINPRRLTPVCKSWYEIMRERGDFPDVELRYSSNMNTFMKKCMNIFWTNQFDNGIITYTNPFRQKSQRKLSELENAMWIIGNISITTVERFFFEESPNDKLLIMSRHMVEKAIESAVDHPFTPIMAGLDPDKASVCMFFTAGNATNFNNITYLFSEDLEQLASCNLRQNWEQAKWLGGNEGEISLGSKLRLSPVRVNFLNQNKDELINPN